MNSEDRAAFLDARIAAVQAPGSSSRRSRRRTGRRSRPRCAISSRAATTSAKRAATRATPTSGPIPIERLRAGADSMAALAAGMKRVAEAADPLYKSLDDGQKRRLALLTRAGTMREGFATAGWTRRDGSDRRTTAATTAGASVRSATTARIGSDRFRRLGLLDAFSSREPVPTSLENAMERQKPPVSGGFFIARSGRWRTAE